MKKPKLYHWAVLVKFKGELHISYGCLGGSRYNKLCVYKTKKPALIEMREQSKRFGLKRTVDKVYISVGLNTHSRMLENRQ